MERSPFSATLTQPELRCGEGVECNVRVIDEWKAAVVYVTLSWPWAVSMASALFDWWEVGSEGARTPGVRPARLFGDFRVFVLRVNFSANRSSLDQSGVFLFL